MIGKETQGPGVRSRAVALALTVSLTSSLVSPALMAQDQPRAENVAAARTLGVQGIQLADAGNCDQAIEKLTRAEALFHVPTILGRLGECQVQVGQIVLGTENLNRVIREQLSANAPKAFRDAQDRAQKVLVQAQPKIAYLTVKVEPQVAQTTVTVGGTPVPAALIGAERPTDPGTHEVVASAPGYHEAKSSVTLAEGGRQEIALQLEKDPNATVTAAPIGTSPTTPGQSVAPTPADAPKKKSNTLAYVLLGVGGAGVVIGSVTGLLAMSKKGDLNCPQDQCPPTEKNKLDSAQTMANVSTTTFGVGLASAAVGTVLLLVNSGSSEKAQTTVKPATASVTPWLGWQSAGVSGKF
jgi:hypothetical protein